MTDETAQHIVNIDGMQVIFKLQKPKISENPLDQFFTCHWHFIHNGKTHGNWRQSNKNILKELEKEAEEYIKKLLV